MPRAVRKQKKKRIRRAAQIEPQVERRGVFRLTRHRVSLALMAVALVYAFLAGLHTVFDFDMGWHLATGRYVVQHHVVPSADVLSYTSPGVEWLYPPFAGALLYGVFSAWGYAGLSWFCALALVATVACLLRHPARQGSGLAAALAIMAVPALAFRANPRADLFTPLFFAIFLVLLWSFYSSNAAVPGREGEAAMRKESARLWILPVSMLFWVNLHPGFVAGLGLVFAYLLIEGLDVLFPRRRWAALQRLRLAGPRLAATLFATLINPYGPRIFKAALLLAGLGATDQQSNHIVLEEFAAVPLSFPSLAQSLDWRSPDSSFWWLALAAVAGIVLAIRRRQFGAALLMAAALYATIEHRRYKALFVIVVAVVGTTVLTELLKNRGQGSAKGSAKRSGLWSALPVIAASALLLVTCVRIADLISSRSYIVANAPMLFGTGESWWFPERAAAFVQREHLPGNVFQVYNLGGFTAWRLGPAYGDFIDGRDLAPTLYSEEQQLLSSPPDSSVWKVEAERRGINFLFFSLARFSGVDRINLMSLCQSKEWRPVYMDEVSIVLLRNRSENRAWIDRYEVNCQTRNLTPPAHASRRELANFYANAGNILLHLGRLSEAREELEQAAALSPDDPSVHLALAQLFEGQQQLGDAENEYKATLSLRRDVEITWQSLGRFYYAHGRYAEARPLVLTAAQLSPLPTSEYILLGAVDLGLRQPEQALTDYGKSEEVGREYWQGREEQNPELFAAIAEGRAGAYLQLGEPQRAIEFQQEATRRTPESASRWKTLGDLYDRAGEGQLAEQARQRASALSK
jgi:Tfp pilus assembly protein PilF